MVSHRDGPPPRAARALPQELQSVERDPLVGRVLGGRYRLEELIGRGGFGAVYRAQQLALDRRVAIKINIHVHRPSLAARFRREAQVMAKLRHPGCVTLLDYGEEADGLIYMVQEYVEGRSLKDVLDAEGYLETGRAIVVVSGILSALAAAHRVGIIHRDIKPSNVMLSTSHGDEEVRVLDFGIAKIFDDDEDLTRLTESGRVIGTPAYMAPEQIRSLEVSPRTDIYAVGVLLFHLLTGRKPFVGSSVFDVYRHHLETPPPTASGQLVPSLSTLIDRAMAKDPGDRFESAAAMREALRRATINLDRTATTALPDAADTVESGPPPTVPSEDSVPRFWHRRGVVVGLALTAALGAWWIASWPLEQTAASARQDVVPHALDSDTSTLVPDLAIIGQDLDLGVAVADGSSPQAMDSTSDSATDVSREPDTTPSTPVQPRTPSWRLALRKGKRAEARGKWEEAEEFFREAIKLAPRRIDPYIALGQLLYQRRKFERAASVLDQARSLDPRNEVAFYYFALAFMRSKGDNMYLYLYRQTFPNGKFLDAVNRHIGPPPKQISPSLDTP
ncbi:MAG: serine/threonine-protein kinase [bacterium]